MKKLFVLLLALAVVTGAFAQVTTAISLSGGVKLIDQDTVSAFEQDGNGYDVLTFKATDKDGKYGFSMTDQNILGADINAADSGINLRDWNVWYKVLDGKMKFTFGALRNADYRTILPVWEVNTFGGTDRINVQGMLVQFMLVDGLNFGFGLPVSTTPSDTVDYTLSGIDLGFAYTITDIGKLTALVRLNESFDPDGTGPLVADTDATMINAGFSFTGMEGLTANLLGKFVTSTNYSGTYFAVGADYAVTEALTASAEFGLSAVEGTTTWDIWARGKYVITDMFYAYATARFDSADAYSFIVTPGIDMGNGFNIELDVGYDSALDFVYDVYFYYAVAF